jgi:hypothetical protein
LAEWKFDLWITNEASVDYAQLKAVAEMAVSSYNRPLPLNGDSRLSARIAAIAHYERTCKILKSIKDPRDVRLDLSLLGIYHQVKYRTELGTTVYFKRLITPPAVLVYKFAEAPLDRDGLRKLILSGDAYLLPRLGLPLPQGSIVSATIH